MLNIRRWEPINLIAIVERSECSAAGELQFEWNATSSLHGVTSETALLYVPPFSMLPGETADVYVSVSTDSTSEAGRASASVACIAEPVVASIRSGDRMVASVGMFLIDATDSLDPDDPKNERESFEYSARCTPLENSNGVKYENIVTYGCVKNDAVYIDATTTSTYATRLPASIGAIDHDTGDIILVWPDGDLRHRFTDVTHAYKDGVRCSDLIVVTYPSCDARAGPYVTRDTEAGVFTVNARFLEAGGTYRFDVTAAKGARADNVSVEVSVSEFSSIPSVAIDYPVQTKYNAAERLALQARQETGLPFTDHGDSAVALSWSIESDDANAVILHPDDSLLATLPTAPNLIVNPSSLSPGSCYTFRVSATSLTGASSFASVNVCMNSAPRGGVLAVEPAVGAALTTDFVLAASGWWDDDAPLRYRFGFESNGRSTLLTGFSSARIVHTVLPPGAYPATCQVADVYSAVSQTVHHSVQVSEYVPTESLSADMDHAIADAQSSGDLSAVSGLVDVFAALLQHLQSRRRLQASAESNQDEIDAAVLMLIGTLHELVTQLPMVADSVSRLSRTLDAALTGDFPQAVVGDAIAVLRLLMEVDGVRDSDTSEVLLESSSTLLRAIARSGDITSARSTSSAVVTAISGLIAELTSDRLAGEYPVTLQTAAFDLTIHTETGSVLDGRDLGATRLPSGVFPNDTTSVHVQHIEWHENPRSWAPQHPAETRGNLTLGASVLGFAIHVEMDELDLLDLGVERTYNLRSAPFLARFSKAAAFAFDNNESHWHCGLWSQELDTWELGGSLVDWRDDSVSCAYDDHRGYSGHQRGIFAVFAGEIPPEVIMPINSLAFYISLAIPVAIMLCGLVLTLRHALLWKDLNVMLKRKKAVVSYLGSTYAAFEYPSDREIHCCRRMLHKMRVRVSLYTVLCGYPNVPQRPKLQRVLVLLTDMAVVISINSIFFSVINVSYMCGFLAILAVPAHVLLDYLLKWLVEPTVKWLRAEWEVQQAFASASFANKRGGVRSKSFAAGKSFKQGSASPLASPSVRSPLASPSIRLPLSAVSFKSPSINAGTSFASASFSAIGAGSMKAATDGSLSHVRHRSALSVLGVVLATVFISCVFSSITLWQTLRWSDSEFADLAIRTGITSAAKWLVLDPAMALSLFPLLARWDAARLARQIAAYAPEDDGHEQEDGGETSPGPSPRKQTHFEDGLEIPQLETKYERQARDRKARIAATSGKGHFQWKRDELGSFKVQKKNTQKKKAAQDDNPVVPKRPAYKVKTKDDQDKAKRSTGITKAMTANLAPHKEETLADQNETPDDPLLLPGAVSAGDADDVAAVDDADDQELQGPSFDDSIQAEMGEGSWVLTRVVKGGAMSWRMLPNQTSLLDALDQDRSDSDDGEEEEDDEEDEEEDDEEDYRNSSDDDVERNAVGSSTSSGLAVQSAVRARIEALAKVAADAGKVEITQGRIRSKAKAQRETSKHSGRQSHQQGQSLNLTAESELIPSSDTTWKIGQRIEI